MGNRGRDTRPELMIRQLLFRQGARYRVDYAPLSDKRRRADIVFPGQRIACFLDGCFWHGCPDHYVAPKKNAEFWNDKVKTNMKRDIDTTARLEEAGWKVLRFWEHENSSDVADEILKAIGRGRQSTAASSQESSA